MVVRWLFELETDSFRSVLGKERRQSGQKSSAGKEDGGAALRWQLQPFSGAAVVSHPVTPLPSSFMGLFDSVTCRWNQKAKWVLSLLA